MLKIEQKIEIFRYFLKEKWESYGDSMKDEIYFYFFENDRSFDFLNELKNEIEIKNKINFLVSKMIMHEHEEGLNNIIESYV